MDLSDQYNGYFDFISMFHVLEHLSNPNIYLEKINQLMKPRAFLIIEVPNIKSIDSLFFKYLIRILQPPHHLYAFNPKNLEFLLKNEFNIVAKKIYFSNVIGDFLKKLLSVMGLPYGKNKLSRSINIADKKLRHGQKLSLSFMLKKLLNVIFPGSIMIIICQKN